VLETTVYRNPVLMDAAMELELRFLQVDMTDFNTVQKQLLERHGGQALPYTVVFDRRGHP
jgi:thiol:disulfide interchange protein